MEGEAPFRRNLLLKRNCESYEKRAWVCCLLFPALPMSLCDLGQIKAKKFVLPVCGNRVRTYTFLISPRLIWRLWCFSSYLSHPCLK